MKQTARDGHMTPRWRWAFFALALASLCVVGSPGAAGGASVLSVRELAANASFIVLGRVVTVANQWNSQRTRILTRIELDLEEVLKGTPATNRLSFAQPGGRVGNVGSLVGDTPRFKVGDRVALFLTSRRDGELGIIGLFQGKFDVERDTSSGLDVAVRRVPGSGETTDRITLDLLRSEVRAVLGK